ncbi:transmembrane protein [Ceratobasidium sp. AG-Ba]|nr:transmembrane protein [Ceratobasidium sp. AG-Ba]QRW04509.1 transmembrane protein [Ceratobasidium sp. AG-Ba]
MVSITATHTDLSISYQGNWNHKDHNISSAISSNSTAFLGFYGTECYVYGQYDNDPSNLQVLVDDQSSNATVQRAPNATDQLILKVENLNPREHNITLKLLDNGGFGINRFVWNDSRVAYGPLIDGRPNAPQGQWNTTSVNSINFQQTGNQSASITFTFEGTGIAVNGLVQRDSGSFSVSLDDATVGNWTAVMDLDNPLEAVLYRNLSLTNGLHTLTLTDSESKKLAVGQAQLFVQNPTPPVSATDAAGSPTASATQSPIPSSSNRGLSKGGAAGVSIAVLASLGLALFALWFWLRRRRAPRDLYEKNQVSYVRVCSKCRQDITGDYRLECVDPNCPAAVDLHPECKDWNTQANHDHKVQQVPNK